MSIPLVKHQDAFALSFVSPIDSLDDRVRLTNSTYCKFDVARYEPSNFSELGILMPESLDRAVAKRQAEFLAGRYVARQTLINLGFPPETIHCGVHRNPIWPEGMIASITHTDTRALCVGSLSSNNDFVGVDIECSLKPDLVQEIKHLIINADEERLLAGVNLDFEEALTIAFSAKECLFKALYPVVGNYFGFDVARVRGLSLESDEITLSLVDSFMDKIKPYTKQVYVCDFERSKQHVTTLLTGKF